MKKIIVLLIIFTLCIAFASCAQPQAEIISDEVMQEAQDLEVNGIFEVNIETVEEVGSQKFVKFSVIKPETQTVEVLKAGETASMPIMPEVAVVLKDGSSVSMEELIKTPDTTKIYSITVSNSAITEVREK